jgi:hypothetical protein
MKTPTEKQKIEREILKVKGDKNSFANTEMEVFWEADLLEIKKGFMSLVLSKIQAKKLSEFISKTI